VNFGTILNNPWIGKDGLKLYAETAILGIKNYPLFYDKMSERIPILVGLNLPTFNFFDVLSVEGEYRKWGFLNSTLELVSNNTPYWDGINGARKTVGLADTTAEREKIKAQDFKWTIYGKKTIVKGVAIYAQVASDWLRGIDQNNVLSELSITQRPSQWYYLFRLEFGI